MQSPDHALDALQGNHGEVAAILVEAGANPNDVYTDEVSRLFLGWGWVDTG